MKLNENLSASKALVGPRAWTLEVGGITAGIVFSRVLREYPFGDAIAPFMFTLLALTIVTLAAPYRPARYAVNPLIVVLFIGVLAIPASMAAGSSWAMVTWIPLVLLSAILSSLSPFFLLTVTGIVSFEFAGPLVILKHALTGSQVSGSVPYFLGFIGAAGAPLWLRFAYRILSQDSLKLRWRKTISIASIAVAALCVWMTLASGSRAAVVGLLAGGALAFVLGIARTKERRKWKRAAALLALVLALVPVFDIGLTRYFMPGATSTVIPVLSQRVAAATSELSRSTGGSFRTRIEYWKQAWDALKVRPLGHGPGSYAHVNHAYQSKPMVWSASPHNFLALIAVEAGVPGLLATILILLLAFYRASKADIGILAALAAATVIVSLDIFSSQPIQNLLWWAVLGAALAAGPNNAQRSTPIQKRRFGITTIMVALLLAGSLAAALRLESACEAENCDPIVRYGGHPAKLRPLLRELIQSPSDPRWEQWEARYPLAFWLRHARAEAANAHGDASLYHQLVQWYPYQSANNYLIAAEGTEDPIIAAQIAACGIHKFFSGQHIWRDHRSSQEELEEIQKSLELIAGRKDIALGKVACVHAGISESIGFRTP